MNTSIDLGGNIRIEFDGSKNWQVILRRVRGDKSPKAGEYYDDILAYHGSLAAACQWVFQHEIGGAGRVGLKPLIDHISRCSARIQDALATHAVAGTDGSGSYPGIPDNSAAGKEAS